MDKEKYLDILFGHTSVFYVNAKGECSNNLEDVEVSEE